MAIDRDRQLPLAIGLQDSATFDNFEPGANRALLHALASDGEPYLYFWGPAGCGKTHLLQAACRRAGEGGAQAVYLPARELVTLSPGVLEDLEALPLLCLDDVEALGGRPEWERALFDLFNRVRDAGGRLLAAGAHAPGGLGIALPDLVSRLSWGPVFHIEALDDADKLRALQRRARCRGLELPAEVGRYLLQRAPRDMPSLFALLERLDAASLAAQRRLTIPFVRRLLDQGPVR